MLLLLVGWDELRERKRERKWRGDMWSVRSCERDNTERLSNFFRLLYGHAGLDQTTATHTAHEMLHVR